MSDDSQFPALKALLDVMEPELFFADIWRKKPRLFSDRPTSVYDDILTVAEIDEILNHGLSQVSSVITQEHLADRREHPFSVTGVDLEEALERFRKGATLVLSSLHLYAPGLKALCRDLARETGARWKANIYVTPPNGQGFATHMDGHCVFVLQIYGEKTWRVGANTMDPSKVVLPVQEADFIRLTSPSDITLRAGDLLYVPRKVPHDASASGTGSVHVTLGMHTISPAEYYKSLLGQMVDRYCGEAGNMPADLPPGFAASGGTEFQEQALAHLLAMLDATDFEDLVGDDLTNRRRALAEEATGRLQELLVRHPVTNQDRFRSTTSHVTVREARGGGIEVLYSGKTIRFPDQAQAAVDFCLSSPGFGLEDLPAGLDDAGRETVVSRLLVEGLVARETDTS